jgi:sporulation integral membrane protein YtvI
MHLRQPFFAFCHPVNGAEPSVRVTRRFLFCKSGERAPLLEKGVFMEKETYSVRDLAACLVCIAFALVGGWLFLRYVFGILLPFLIGWGLACAARPLADRVGRGTRIPKRILRLLFVLATFLALGVGGWLLGARLVRELEHLLTVLSDWEGFSLPPALTEFFSHLPGIGAEGAESYVAELLSGVLHSLTGALPTVLGYLVSAVPRMTLALTVTLISSVYFSLDLEHIHRALLRPVPERLRGRVASFRGGVLRIAGTYLRSYLILACITFSLMLVGLLILQVDYALLLAFLISLVDLFPVLGVGTVLLPWSFFCFLLGAPGRGVGLLLLWGVALLLRQLTEPRLLGGSLGVPPLLTLFSMYAGLKLGGVIGMLLFPALCVPLLSLMRGRENAQNAQAQETRKS